MEHSWILLVLMTLMLGARHGLDMDHIAIINSITQTTRGNHFFSKIVGLLFSLGHGIIVTLISLIIGTGMMRAHFPSWLDNVGNWMSILLLFIFGVITLLNVLRGSSQLMPSKPFYVFLSKKLMAKQGNPILVMMIGAIFALSFDTISQVGLFSISAAAMKGWLFSGVLGIAFMVGMMATDGLNGLLVFNMIQ